MSINIGVNIQRSPNRINQALRNAGVNGAYPKLLFDFNDEYYLTGGSSKTFANAMTFSRTGNATMVDVDGKIKWAPHNLLTYSEDYTAGKSSNNITLTSGVADPLGGTNAYTLTATAINGFFRGSSSITVVPQTTYTVAVFSKNVSGTIKIGAYDLTNGAPITSSELTNSTNEWALEFHEFTAPVGCTSVYVYAAQQTTNGASYDSFGFHTYRSDLGGMVNNPDRGDSYVPTTSSAVYLPRRGHHKYNGDQWVNKGILVESEARTNLITYANPTNGQWTVAQGTLTENAVTSPDGQTSASSFVTNTNNAEHYTEESLAVTSGTTYTFSIYLKDNGYGTGCLRIPSLGFVDNAYFIFDFNTAQITTTVGTMDAYGVEKAGNGWVRAYMTRTSDASTSALFRVHVKQPTAFVGDGLSGIYLYGGMVEAASTPSSYIPTNGSTVTRAAETVTVPYANLPWPTPTYIGDELVTNGTFDTDSDWVKGGSWAISGGLATQPSGAVANYLIQADVLTIGKVYSYSVDVISANGSNFPQLYTEAGVVQSFTSGAGTYTGIFVAAGNDVRIRAISPSLDVSIDNISVREINPLSVSIAMMGEMNYADYELFDKPIMFRWYDSLTDRIFMSLDTNNGTGEPKFYQEANDVADFTQGDGSYFAPDLNVPFNIASRHGSTFINGAVDGTALTADTTPVALPDLSTTNLNLAYDFMGTISEFRIFDRDIGDTGIAEATKPSTEPSLSLTFDGQPSSFTNGSLVV